MLADQGVLKDSLGLEDDLSEASSVCNKARYAEAARVLTDSLSGKDAVGVRRQVVFALNKLQKPTPLNADLLPEVLWTAVQNAKKYKPNLG